MRFVEDARFRFRRKVDKHISKKYNVHRRQSWWPTFDQIDLPKLYRLPNFIPNLPLKSRLRKVLEKHWHW